MRKPLQIFIVLISFSLFAILLLQLIYVSFIPEINTVIKKNYAWISLALTVIGLFVLFKLRAINLALKIIIALGLLIVLTGAFARSMFYTKYNQQLVEKISDKVYIISTYNGDFPICKKQYSMVKRIGVLFVKEIYNIGCSDYKLKVLDNHNIQIITIQQPLVIWHKPYSDTAVIKY